MVGWGEKGLGTVLVCAGGTRGVRRHCRATRHAPEVAGRQAGVAQGSGWGTGGHLSGGFGAGLTNGWGWPSANIVLKFLLARLSGMAI